MEIQQLYNKYAALNKITTDSRTNVAHSLFFCLKGAHFDGNNFANQAIEKGASYVVADDPKKVKKHENIIWVDDVLSTLQALAKYHRIQCNFNIIAITGSNGKTTTKELTSKVLTRKYKTFATPGNLNNHIGVPLTLLSFPADTEIGIVEMGANDFGEIDFLCRLALPDYGLITNIGKAHLEKFKDVNGVLKAKSELYKYLMDNRKTIFINKDDPHLTQKLSRYSGTKWFYGNTNDCHCIGQIIADNPTLSINFKTTKEEIMLNSQISGSYNFYNILAAASIGDFFKVPLENIKQAIESYKPQNNRSQIVQTKNNTIFLDAYNANPTSMKVVLENFISLASDKKMVILGEMKELGDCSEKEHYEIIKQLSNSNIDPIILFGKDFNLKNLPVNIMYFSEMEPLKKYLQSQNIQQYKILIKGSRANRLESLINLL